MMQSKIIELLYPDKEVIHNAHSANFDVEYQKQQITCYKNREFAKEFILEKHYKCLKNYQHIKQNSKTYLIFDIDKIDISKVSILFNNNAFVPNFYIYEYSKNKKCFTLQIFILLDKAFRSDNIIKKYKQLCILFSADLNYQIKTGIHKNPAAYEIIDIDENNIKIVNKNQCGFIHSRTHNFDNLVKNLEFFYDLDNLELAEKEENEPKLETITIKEISSDVVIKKTTSNQAKEKTKEIGTRNITLFNKTREIAYSIDDKSIENIIHIAKRINSEFKTKLSDKEVIKTAKSIAMFIAKNFNFEKLDPFSDFQRQLSAKTRAASAYNKITNAIRQLEGENKEITKTAVFRITKQDKRTITKFFNSCLSSIQAVKSLNAAMLNIAQQQKLERSNKHVCSIT